LSSLFDMSLKEYNFILQKYLFLSDLFNNKEIIKTIHSPLLIIHWNKDTLIPFAQGKIVYNNSKSKKSYFLEMNNVWHNSLLQKYEKTMLWFLKVFLEKWELEKKYFFIDENTKIPEIKKEEKKIVPLENLKKLDYINDTSLTKYVWYWKSFEEINYIPLKLKKIRGNYIKDIKWWQLLREEALIALDEMGKDFYKIFSTKISIVSWYRSYFYQSQIKSGTCPDNLCSKPWYSEHQSGLAIDLWETTTEKDFLSKKELNSYFLRLKENAHRYWFHNSYQNGVEIDWYDKEPWHWRYLWKDLASYLYKEKISFSQFYKKLNTKESKE
jgi:LAS superfamily LD-carboxypeptidase LdcB